MIDKIKERVALLEKDVEFLRKDLKEYHGEDRSTYDYGHANGELQGIRSELSFLKKLVEQS